MKGVFLKRLANAAFMAVVSRVDLDREFQGRLMNNELVVYQLK